MVIVSESVQALKGFLRKTRLNEFAMVMILRMVVAFISHQGRMSCSAAAGSIASEAVHRGHLTRFLARTRWQKVDFNDPLRSALLQMETCRGRFIFIIDATLVSQAGEKTQNTYSTGNRSRKRRSKKGRRYKKKIVLKKCHSFTFGLLITPSGFRIPYEIPHYTKEYCQKKGLVHRTTAESAADLIRGLPLPAGADVVVLGDTAYDAEVVHQACADRDYLWIVPANPERVYEGSKGHRQKLRSRLKDWSSLSLKTIRFQASNLKTATPDDVKLLMTNATDMSVSEVIELYSLRWQIELFFKELKSTLGFSQYRFRSFDAVKAWAETAITTVLFLEHERARHLADQRLSQERRQWWEAQRLHGLCSAFREETAGRELKYLSDRLKTSGGIEKLKRLIAAALPKEFRVAG